MEEKLLKDFELHLQKTVPIRSAYTKTKALEQFFDWCKEQSIQPSAIHYSELLDYMKHCKQKVSIVTVNNYMATIRNFYKYLVQQQQREDNPAMGLVVKGAMKKSPMEALNKDELEVIYKTYPSNGIIHKRNRCMLGFLVYQGLQTGEVLRLQVKDLRLNEGTIYVPATLTANARILKLEALQAIHLQSYLLSIRKAFLAMHKKPTDLLFFSTTRAFYLMLKQVKANQGKVKSFQHLRSSIIVHWLKSYDIRQVQYMAGHQKVSSTAYYRTDQLESLQEQLEKLHPLR